MAAKDEAGKAAQRLLDQARREGRRVLVVVGAGCSFAAGMPLMRDVYGYLHEAVRKRAETSGKLPRLLSELETWLSSLAGKDPSPRSVAARALGLLQQAHTGGGLDLEFGVPALAKELDQIWLTFARDFLAGEVTPATRRKPQHKTILHYPPTELHRRIAQWVCEDNAVALSLNFDGLTRVAIDDRIGPTGGSGVILTNPEQIDKYFLAEESDIKQPTRAVIKVWGDVFHATCRNARCPAFDTPVGLYDLRASSATERHKTPKTAPPGESGPSVAEVLSCPDCGRERQLEVFFSGYQKKEQNAERVFEALRKRVLPGIAGAIVIGVSGVWDQSLTRLLEEIGRSRAKDDREYKVAGTSTFPRLLCVDPHGMSFWGTELRSRGVAVELLEVAAEELAVQLQNLPQLAPAGADSKDTDVDVELLREFEHLKGELLWHDLLAKEAGGPAWLPAAVAEVKAADPRLDKHFSQLRQLGLKTAMLQPAEQAKHNRRAHSLGVARIALAWLTEVLKNQGGYAGPGLWLPADALRSVGYLAGLMHDLSHLPFTHLTEEVYDELNWTARDWSERFRHDSSVLSGSYKPIREWARQALGNVAERSPVFKDQPGLLECLVGRAIEGRTGIPLLDCVLNSPIDADKIEYLASDCLIMRQEVRLPIRDWEEEWRPWIDAFFQGQRVLPSGIVAIAGAGAVHARELLEERRWLYKHLYFRQGFRVVERILHHLLVHWLSRAVGEEISRHESAVEGWNDGDSPGLDQVLFGARGLTDPRASKGRIGARLLWEQLVSISAQSDAAGVVDRSKPRVPKGEPALAQRVADDLVTRHTGTSLEQWFRDCRDLIDGALIDHDGRTYDQFERFLRDRACWSPPVYIRASDLKRVREIVRRLEMSSVPSALVDLAPLPSLLSYPAARRTKGVKDSLLADTWVVPHYDPDKWDRESRHWVPLSATAFGERDRHRWVQVMVVAPRSDGHAAVQHMIDRFGVECSAEEVEIKDSDPEG